MDIVVALLVLFIVACVFFTLGVITTSLCHLSSEIDFDLGDYEWK